MSNYNIKLTPNFIGKTPQEKADLVRDMLESLSDDHPLVVNLRKR